MVAEQFRALAPSEVGAAAIRHLSTYGFEATTAGDLADAIGMSRSTFFRRFGSKDDVIFADHDLALQQLEAELASATAAPLETLTRAIAGVMQLLTRDAEAAGLRSELLRQNPVLRDRELVITHRYERVCGTYLRRVAAPDTPAWVPVAVAASAVAVHNAALRRWLRDPDPRSIGTLDAELHALLRPFAPWFGGHAAGSTHVVVAAFEADTSPDSVLRAIAEQLAAR